MCLRSNKEAGRDPSRGLEAKLRPEGKIPFGLLKMYL